MRWYGSVEILQSVIAAAVDEITQPNIGWGCVKWEVAKVEIEKWATVERGTGTAHPETLTPEDEQRGAIRPGDPDTWLDYVVRGGRVVKATPPSTLLDRKI